MEEVKRNGSKGESAAQFTGTRRPPYSTLFVDALVSLSADKRASLVEELKCIILTEKSSIYNKIVTRLLGY